jgi:hypothetical protein
VPMTSQSSWKWVPAIEHELQEVGTSRAGNIS